MKWLLLLLAIGLTASEKLDRTYLPPPGSQYSGGHPGDIQAPHLPHHAQHVTTPIQQSLNGLQDFVPNGPVTTTSYAYTQTTTFPPESYETTVTPINSVTGLPEQYSGVPDYQQYGQIPSGFNQNQGQLVHDYNANGPREFGAQSPGDETLTITSPNYNQATIQRTPGSNIQIPGSITQRPHITQGYEQISNNRPVGQINQYPEQNVINPESGIRIPGTDLQNIYDNEYTGSQGSPSGQVPQGSYSGQPSNVKDARKPQFPQEYPNDGTISSQPSPSRSQNILRPASAPEQNIHHTGQGYSSTPLPGSAESSSVYSPINPVFRPERPQSAAERNAVILNYENVRTPNGYFYSYDTSNGIHADETGTVGDGTRAQGSYSYTGDDGKVYSVVYTADENGFRPHGDHLPTPPPIPEAIIKVIEQAARDKEAGIIDDGSYDENKYGDKKYQRPLKHHRPYNQGINKAGNKHYYEDDRVLKPISGINNDEYNENSPQEDFVEYFGDTNKKPIVEAGSQYPPSTIMNEINRIRIVPSKIEDSDNNLAISGIPNYKSGTNSPSEVDNYDAKQDQFDSQDHLSDKIPSYARKSTKTKSRRPQAEVENTYTDSQNDYESEFNNNDNGNFDDGSRVTSVPSSTNFLSDRKQTSSKQRPKGEKITSDRYSTSQTPQSGERIHQEVDIKQTANPLIEPGSIQNYGNYQPENQDGTQDENGYRYKPPQTKFFETEIRNRFKDQKVPSSKKPMDHNEYEKVTTVRPFQTPEVYNQPSSVKSGSRQSNTSITREPFMTSRVTTPKSSTYTDYDDDEDYGTDQDDYINKDTSATRRPGEKIGIPISRTHQSSTAKPQNSLLKQRPRVSQEGTVTPGIGYSDNVAPASTYKSTTATPSQSSRFGSTEPPRIQGQQNLQQPSIIVRRPAFSTEGYSSLAGISDASTKEPLAYGSRLPSAQRGSSLQYYPTTTYAPSSKITPTSDYHYGSEDLGPSSKFRSYLPSSIDTYKTGYEPFRTQYSTTGRPISPTVRPFSSKTYPESTPGYQTTYPQSHSGIGNATPSPSTTVRPGTFTLSGPRTVTPTFSPNGPYQTSYQYGSTTPVNIPTIGSSTPATSPNYKTMINYEAPGSQVSQISPGRHEYNSTVYTYSTTASPSTIGTTPGSLIPSTISGQMVFGYPTTQQPSYGAQNNYQTVDAFGKPIVYEQQPEYSPGQPIGQYPGSQSGTGTNISKDNSRPAYDDQSSGYPRYDKPKFIGEDFSGPKQPQRYDPQTGYHY